MEKLLINVSLENYEAGVAALARIKAMRSFTIKSTYNISREDIAAILGFELPTKEE